MKKIAELFKGVLHSMYNGTVPTPVKSSCPKAAAASTWYPNLRTICSGEVQLSKGCRLLYRKLHYSVKTKNGELELLKGVSGRSQPGEMCALMGASGAGKSTLLDILAGRKTVGSIQVNSFWFTYVISMS